MIILDINKRIFPENAASHIDFPFIINRPANELIVNFSFNPEIIEDKDKAIELVKDGFMKYYNKIDESKINNYLPAKNLLTVSIDSPEKTLGTAHRHMGKQTHNISSDKASRGFIPSKILSGKWNVTISIHAIVTEFVDIKLTIEALYD